jgi:hypothetical protein
MKEKHKIHEDLIPLKAGIDDFRPDPKNARKNHDVDGIAASLKEYHQRKPIVINSRTGAIEAGNGTWKAAKKLGWTHIAVLVVDEDRTAQIGFSVADNLLTDKSKFDITTLSELFNSIDDPTDIPGVDNVFLDDVMPSKDFLLEDPEEEYIDQGYEKIHILISVDVDKYVQISKLIEEMSENNFVEIEKSAN